MFFWDISKYYRLDLHALQGVLHGGEDEGSVRNKRVRFFVGGVLSERHEVYIFCVEKRADILGVCAECVIRGHGQHHGLIGAQGGFNRHRYGRIRYAVRNLCKRIPRARRNESEFYARFGQRFRFDNVFYGVFSRFLNDNIFKIRLFEKARIERRHVVTEHGRKVEAVGYQFVHYFEDVGKRAKRTRYTKTNFRHFFTSEMKSYIAFAAL